MRILFLARVFPHPPNDGGRIRIYHMLRAFAERHEVTFAGLQDGCRQNGFFPNGDSCDNWIA